MKITQVRKAGVVLRALARATRSGTLRALTPGGTLLGLEYPILTEARYGYKQPPLQSLVSLLDTGRPIFERSLRRIVDMSDELATIPVETRDPADLSWTNRWLGGLDAAALYTYLAHETPATYLEIGSGFSTRFARRSIDKYSPKTKIISIDPAPRSSIDTLSDEVIRVGLESADAKAFDRLVSGDLLFLDGSHYCFTNSDVTVFFLEILPKLRKGVLVHIHDIFLPYDYPPEWQNRFYSEQYLLAALLLGGSSFFDVVLPNYFVHRDEPLHNLLAPLWTRMGPAFARYRPTSFWLRTK